MKTQLLLIAYLPLISCGQLFNNEAIHSMATDSLEKKLVRQVIFHFLKVINGWMLMKIHLPIS